MLFSCARQALSVITTLQPFGADSFPSSPMSPDQLARELEDLQRFSPPAGDPIALLERDTRIADLQQENEELQQLAASRASQLATVSLDLDHHKQQLARLQSERDSFYRKVQQNDAEFRWKEALWSEAALKESADQRSKRLQSVYWISLAVASLALAFTAVWIGQKYWSYTHDDHLLLHEATAERAKATALLSEARQTFDRATRLQKQKQRPKSPTTPAAKPAAVDQNGTTGEAK